MNKNISKLACLAAFCVASLAGQTAGEGGITGVVSDAGGAVVPAAKVVVENLAKGIHRELTSSGAGVFSVPSLPPADGYAVTISKDGFSTYQITNVAVQVGEMVSLRASLQVGSAATRVDVNSDAVLVDSAKTDTSSLVDSRQILELPINGRRVDSFVLLTPGVTSDASFGLLSFRGQPGGNAFLTDGVDTTNQFYDENAGRTRTYNISQDAVQEFQVITSNYLAEYGRASGGVINTVTRSGSNSLHGTAYWFFRNRTLNATDPTANGLNPQDWRHQAGASIGGPIKKDKLFYFFNGELQRRNFPIVSSNTANSIGTCALPATPAQCSAALAFINTRTAPQLVPRTSDVNLLFGKIDYQINTANRFSVEMNYLDFRSPNGIQTQTAITNGGAIGNNANTNVFDRTLKASLTSVITPNAVNELRYGFFKDRQYDPASPSLLPVTGPVGLTVGSVSNLGYATGYPRLLPSELRNQVLDAFSYVHGKHTMKFGFDYSHVEDYINNLANQFGSYTFPSITAFAEDFSSNTSGAKDWSRYTQTIGNPVVDLNLNEFQIFVQDEWHLTSKLTVTPGARYEFTTIPQPTQVNPALPQTGHIPETTLNLAPRFGLAYSINDKTVLRAGYGIFFNRYVSAAIESLFFGNGLYQPSYTLNSNVASQQAAGPTFPARLVGAPSVAGTANLVIADPSFRNSYSQQANFAVERQIARNTSLTVSYVWSRGLHITSAYDANAAAPTSSYTYPILNASGTQVSSYTTPLYTTRINPAFGKIIDVTSNANSYYNALIVQFNKRYSAWFQAQANYTWSHAIDDDIGGAAGGPAGSSGILYAPLYPTSVFNGDEKGEKGSSSNDQRHRLVVNGIFSPTLYHGDNKVTKAAVNGWQLSVISTFASSFPLPPTISVSAAPAGVLSTSTLNGLGGATRVPFESISALNVAPIYRTDARLAKTFSITERVRMQLMFEASNVFNHYILEGSGPRNSLQYTTKTVTLNGASVVALSPNLTYGAPLQTQAPPDGTTARRAQAAIRFTF